MQPKSKILLVEDDEVDIESIQRVLSGLKDIELIIARNGIEALDLLFGHNGVKRLDPPPRLIILDIKMPLMNGIEFLKKLRGDPNLAALNVVVLTTSNIEKDKVDALNLNIAGYFLKPVQQEEFLRLCKILL